MAAQRSLGSLAFLLAALLVGCTLDFEGDDDIGDPPLDPDAPCGVIVDAPWFDAELPDPDARPPVPDARPPDRLPATPDARRPCNEGYPDAQWPDAPGWPDAATRAR